ncbi:MAG: DUF3179 domain-containing protein [Spirochaetaceae bacterium]|nr:MAG: DUF3179 domain-containing protein [Spirochaetaceae bacterium]
MKQYVFTITAAVLIATVVAAGFATGGREQTRDADTAQDGVVGPAAEARQQMRRLVTIGAELRTDGGSYVPVDLPPALQHQPPPSGASQFKTDFARALIPYSEVVAGGPPKDGIPAIDTPRFVSVAAAERWMGNDEAVLAVTVRGTTHLYPLQILMWHEIVNDQVGDTPLAVTYCPLCNTGVVFERRFDRELLDFGVTGRLIYSNMIMYDRQTESWWVQATGRGVAGRYAGQQLALVPSTLLPWRQARDSYPQAQVLSFETGYRRDYGRNPYVGYDSAADPFLYRGPQVTDADSEDAMMRVLSVYHGDAVAAISFPQLAAERVVRRELDGTDVVVFWAAGTASALDDSWVSGGRDVGTANAFYPLVDGHALSFRVDNDRITDRQTGSVWNEAGLAVEGQLAGRRLDPALSVHHFLFSWRAFHPSASPQN